MAKSGRGHCSYIPEYFSAGFRPELLQQASALVGMHPDEATEAIVDAALANRKPFAVVPCCVFPTLFPGRTLADGSAVVHTQQFALYLASKDRRIRIRRLPFEGRNLVVYADSLGSAEDKTPLQAT